MSAETGVVCWGLHPLQLSGGAPTRAETLEAQVYVGNFSGMETDPMIQDINEPISVLTRFSGGQMDPLRFKWKSRVFDVDRVTGKWEVREGQFKCHHFSIVTAEEDYYELIYNTRTMDWLLSKTDLEG